jgi:hypothetical protein
MWGRRRQVNFVSLCVTAWDTAECDVEVTCPLIQKDITNAQLEMSAWLTW